jgi:hypothetical protein
MLSVAASIWGCLFAVGLVGAICATSVNAIRKLVRSKSIRSRADDAGLVVVRRKAE